MSVEGMGGNDKRIFNLISSCQCKHTELIQSVCPFNTVAAFRNVCFNDHFLISWLN